MATNSRPVTILWSSFCTLGVKYTTFKPAHIVPLVFMQNESKMSKSKKRVQTEKPIEGSKQIKLDFSSSKSVIVAEDNTSDASTPSSNPDNTNSVKDEEQAKSSKSCKIESNVQSVLYTSPKTLGEKLKPIIPKENAHKYDWSLLFRC